MKNNLPGGLAGPDLETIKWLLHTPKLLLLRVNLVRLGVKPSRPKWAGAIWPLSKSTKRKNGARPPSAHVLATCPRTSAEGEGGMSTFEVVGSHGLLEVCATSGQVKNLTAFDGSSDYAAITKFDVAEWRAFWLADLVDAQLDILDIGFWETDQYTPAEADWRDQVRAAREQRRFRSGSPLAVPRAA
ncbi:MAG: hypothetical protein ACRDRQ_27620 [Pseudonocardiaceae bacterium]